MTSSCPTSRLVAALTFTAAGFGAAVGVGVAVVVVVARRQYANIKNPINPFQEETP